MAFSIDASSVNFLDVDIYHFVNPYLYIIGFANVQSMCFDFGYLDFDRTFTLDLYHYTDGDTGQLAHTIRYREGGAKAMDYDLFAELYTQLLFTQLLGPAEDQGMSAEQVMQTGELLLSLEVTTVSGRKITYDFYSYGERHVLAAVDGSASFYTLSRHVKKLATDIQKLIADEPFEHDPFY